MGDLIQIVDSIAASPTVLLDLNNDTPWACSAFSAPPPPLRRATASTLLVDGGYESASAYDIRTIEMTLELRTATQDLNATSLQTLGRLLNAPSILKYQPTGATSPVFFNLRRGDIADIVDLTGPAASRDISLSLPADPFALGLQETTGAVTIHNDPAVPQSNLSPPVLNAPSTATTGGTLAAATYYYVLTALTSAGETTISNRVSQVTTGSTSTITNSWTAVTGATQYKLYRSTVSGSELLLITLALVTSYVDTGAFTPSGAWPGANTTAGKPCFYALPTIKGDVAAPLRAAVTPSAGGVTTGFRAMLAASALDAGTVYTAPIVWPIGGTDGWTAGTDTGASVANTAYAGNNYRAVSFATNATLLNRITGVAPTAPPVGQYRVLVRVARSDLSSTFSFKFGQYVFGVGYVYGIAIPTMERAVSSGNGHATWVDLGVFAFPRNNQAPKGQEGTAAVPDIALQVGRLTGTGSCNLDSFILVPVALTVSVANSILYTEFPNIGIAASGGQGVWDSALERFWDYNGAALRGSVAEHAGGFPYVTPGAVNLFHFLHQVGGRKPPSGSDTSDLITANASITFTYNPRYLFVRPAST